MYIHICMYRYIYRRIREYAVCIPLDRVPNTYTYIQVYLHICIYTCQCDTIHMYMNWISMCMCKSIEVFLYIWGPLICA